MKKGKRIPMFQGDTETLVTTINKGASPQPLTDATIKFSVKRTEDASTYLIQKSSDNSEEIEITDAENGVCKIYLIESDTENLSPGFYPYDIELTLPSGEKKTVAKEFLVIYQDIT